MQRVERYLFDLGMMDRLSRSESLIHHLDARAKVLVAFAFCISVVSYGKYAVAPLCAFMVYPAIMISVAGLPWRYLLKKLLLVAPFALMVGIFNPVLDREVLLNLGSLPVSGGWISFISIMFRFVLTVMAVLVLLATTGIDGVCGAFDRMGFPRVFAVQVMFLYRYIFLLTEETLRIVRARAVRGAGVNAPGIPVFIRIVGSLLVRSIDRAHRVYAAMESRGFDGHVRTMRAQSWTYRETVFVFGWLAVFVLLRSLNAVEGIGRLIMEFAL